MSVLSNLVKCIIIFVVLFMLSLGESVAEWFASNINGDFFIGCIWFAIIAIIVMSVVKPNKL